MKMKLWNLACVALCAFVLLSVVGCGAQTTKQSKSGETYYTKYNFHYKTEKGKAWGSVANLTKPPAHKILPYGSSVKIEPWKRGFNLIAPKYGKTINVVSKKKYLEGKKRREEIIRKQRLNALNRSGAMRKQVKKVSAERGSEVYYRGMMHLLKKERMLAAQHAKVAGKDEPFETKLNVRQMYDYYLILKNSPAEE